MVDASFVVREIPARKLQKTTAIPWAEPAPATTAVLTAYLAPQQFYRPGSRQEQRNPELNTYPETPAGYYSGYLPGSILAESNRISFKRDHQALPQVDVYPAAVVPEQPLTAFLSPQQFKRVQAWHERRVSELNVYPDPPGITATPAVRVFVPTHTRTVKVESTPRVFKK